MNNNTYAKEYDMSKAQYLDERCPWCDALLKKLYDDVFCSQDRCNFIETRDKVKTNRCGRAVEKLDQRKRPVARYRSMNQAHEVTGISITLLQAAIERGSEEKGFFWRYAV
jgi:hypothetical protein